MFYTHILFDLDGTLTDPKIGITRAVAHALKSFEIVVNEDALDTLTPFIGPPLIDSFKAFYGFSDEEAISAIKIFRTYYSDKGLYENIPYPGIESLLKLLSARDIKLYIATSKPTVYAEKILEHFGLLKYFRRVAGSEMNHSRIHKSEVIQWLLKAEDIPTETALMVGDRRYDIEGARACHIACIAVGYGYGSEEEFDAARPAYRARTVEQLKDLLCKLI